jgi:hypothetical protein
MTGNLPKLHLRVQRGTFRLLLQSDGRVRVYSVFGKVLGTCLKLKF